MRNALASATGGPSFNALAPQPAQFQPGQDDPLPGELQRLGFGPDAHQRIGEALIDNGDIQPRQLDEYNGLDDQTKRLFWQRVIGGESIDEALQPQGYADPARLTPFDDSNMRLPQAGQGFDDARAYQTADAAPLAVDAVSSRNFAGKSADQRRGLARLSRIEGLLSENPEIVEESQSLGGAARRKFLEMRDYAFPGSLDQEQEEFLADTTKFRMNVTQNVNLGIKEMTGAQMSEAEAGRIMAGMPNQNDSPTVFKAKLEEAMFLAKMASAREAYWARNGLPGAAWDNIPLQDMQQVLQQRGAEIYNTLLQQGVAPNDARGRAAAQLAQEFGL